MRNLALLAILMYLAACGMPQGPTGPAVTPAVVPFAAGPVQKACVAADRKQASQRLCGCVQAVANDTLSNREQTRAVTFFQEPQKAQVARSNDGFWIRYKAFASRAEVVCARA